MVTLADIAKKAGCTGATVSLVLNGSTVPTVATRERVLAAARELGYVRNRLARSLTTGKSQVLGLVMPHSSDLRYGVLIDSINEHALEKGYQLMIQFTRWSLADEEKAIKSFLEFQVDGLIVYCNRSPYAESDFGQMLGKTSIPKVLIGSMLDPADSGIFQGAVESDYAAGAFMLGKHLAEQGHSRVDLLQPSYFVQRRRRAVMQGIERVSGLEVHPHFIFPDEGKDQQLQDVRSHGCFAYEHSAQTDWLVKRYLEMRSDATAVIVSNEMVAWRLHAALNGSKDLSIACFGTSGLSRAGAVDVTSVEYSTAEVAERAIQLLFTGKDSKGKARRSKIAPLLSPGRSVYQLVC